MPRMNRQKDNLRRNNNNNIFNIKKNNSDKNLIIDKILGKREINNKSKNKNHKEKNSKFSFNIFEILISLIFSPCLNGQLKLKNNLSDKANVFLYNKLDIIVYIRNMILFDIMNNIILDNKTKDIANFISRPILPSNNE